VAWLLEEADVPGWSRERPVGACGWVIQGPATEETWCLWSLTEGIHNDLRVWLVLKCFHPGQPERGAGSGCWCSLCSPERCVFGLC